MHIYRRGVIDRGGGEEDAWVGVGGWVGEENVVGRIS